MKTIFKTLTALTFMSLMISNAQAGTTQLSIQDSYRVFKTLKLAGVRETASGALSVRYVRCNRDNRSSGGGLPYAACVVRTQRGPLMSNPAISRRSGEDAAIISSLARTFGRVIESTGTSTMYLIGPISCANQYRCTITQ